MNEFSFSPRKNLRLQGFDYGQPGYYFITVCSKNSRCFFGTVELTEVRLTELGEIVRECWLALPGWFPGVGLHEFIVMPNHFHGLLEIQQRDSSLKSIVGSFKSAATRLCRQRGYLHQQNLWHRGYYDHVIRSENSLTKVREYILNNPINWHLDRLNPESIADNSTHGILPTL